ncbi:MAG TPA: hypothetical protein VMW69_01460, partial [Spirochaetia bacterium]|nr:hypothetical protein [Spirochaetia bacterium]
MTPRERIDAVLSHRETDRPPCDLWCTPEVMADLLSHFGTESEEEVYEGLGIDKIAWVEAPHRRRAQSSGKPGVVSDEWGVGRRWVDYGKGRYQEVVGYPLSGIEESGRLDEHRWPDPELYDFEALAAGCRRYAAWYRMLTFVSIFEVYCWLKPMDQSLIDLYVNPDFAHALIEKILGVQRLYIENALAEPGAEFEMVYLSDDFGMQDRLLI